MAPSAGFSVDYHFIIQDITEGQTVGSTSDSTGGSSSGDTIGSGAGTSDSSSSGSNSSGNGGNVGSDPGGTTLTVGSGEHYSTIQDAVNAAQSGDTIKVDAGNYSVSDLKISKSLTLEGVGGLVNVDAGSVEKGAFIVGTTGDTPTVTIEGFAIYDATSSSGNGAGVRYQAGNLTLKDDYIHNDQDGELATPFTADTGSVTIDQTEVAYSGGPSGPSHDIYIGSVARFTLENSFIHDAVYGHEVKSRAANNTIVNNTIAGLNGTDSYEVDLPNGGSATVSANMIEKGLGSSNPNFISYGEAPSSGADGPIWSGSLSVDGNAFVNDTGRGNTVAVHNYESNPISVTNDAFYGIGKTAVGPADISGAVTLGSQPAISEAPPWAAAVASGNYDTASPQVLAGLHT